MAEERGKPKFKSEFSMGQYDFERYNVMIKNIDMYGYLVRIGQYQYIKNLYALLCQLYAYWKPILYNSPETREIEKIMHELDRLMPRTDKRLNNNMLSLSPRTVYDPVIRSTSNKLIRLLDLVIHIRQCVGLGIQVRSEMGKRKLMRIGMRGIGADIPRDDTESGA